MVECRKHRTAYIFLWENLKDKDCLEYPGVDGRIIVKLIIQRLDGRAWTGLILLMGMDWTDIAHDTNESHIL